MTIAGLIGDGRRAMIWADEELFSNGTVSGRADKIVLHHTMHGALLGVGLVSIARRAEEALRRCETLAEALDAVPRALRKAAGDALDRGRAAGRVIASAAALVALDPATGRIAAHAMEARNLFAPELTRAALWGGEDMLGELRAMCPHEPADIAAIAVPQLEELRRLHPDAGLRGDVLHIATVALGDLHIRRLRLPPLAPIAAAPGVEHVAPAEPPALRLVPRDAPMTYQPQRLAHS